MMPLVAKELSHQGGIQSVIEYARRDVLKECLVPGTENPDFRHHSSPTCTNSSSSRP
jgi:hypothetical protein